SAWALAYRERDALLADTDGICRREMKIDRAKAVSITVLAHNPVSGRRVGHDARIALLFHCPYCRNIAKAQRSRNAMAIIARHKQIYDEVAMRILLVEDELDLARA